MVSLTSTPRIHLPTDYKSLVHRSCDPLLQHRDQHRCASSCTSNSFQPIPMILHRDLFQYPVQGRCTPPHVTSSAMVGLLTLKIRYHYLPCFVGYGVTLCQQIHRMRPLPTIPVSLVHSSLITYLLLAYLHPPRVNLHSTILVRLSQQSFDENR